MISKEDFKKHVFEWRDELVTRGYEVREIVGIEFIKSCRTLGRCRRLSATKALLFFSESLLSIFDDEDGYETCKETILHELIHAIPSAGKGHGWQFKAYAGEFNMLFSTAIGSHCDASTVGAFRKANLTLGKYKYRVYCDCGCFNAYRARGSKLTQNPEHYFCRKCGGKLYVEAL